MVKEIRNTRLMGAFVIACGLGAILWQVLQ